MKAFSLRRFALTLQYLGIVRWRFYAYCLFVPMLLCAALMVDFDHFWRPFPHEIVEWKGIFFVVMLLVSSFFCVRAIFPKDGRSDEYTQFLALPASNLEKFTASLLMRVGAPLLCAIVGFYLAVLIVNPLSFWRVFTSPAFSGGGFGLPAYAGYVPPESQMAFSAGVLLLLPVLVIWPLVFFVFSGAFFARLKWILAFLLQGAILAGVAIVVVQIDHLIDFDEYMINYTALVWWIDVVLYVTAALLLWGSYVIFRRSQAVNGRFINI